MKEQEEIEKTASVILKLSNTIAIAVVLLLITFLVLIFDVHLPEKKTTDIKPPQADSNGLFTESAREEFKQKLVNAQFWHAPDFSEIENENKKDLIAYGKDLIVNTSLYFGETGTVFAKSTNGLNCQNCHLEAGTKVFGNNYGSVASTYPKYRARSGEIENLYKRVNDCFERSLNGKSLDTNSKEMQAISAYIQWIGKDVEKGKKAAGSGLKDISFLDRAAEPALGNKVYAEKCQSCHQKDGSGLMNADKTAFTYPPLWGPKSYNDGAGLFRLSNFAKYVKYNMPLGASHTSAQLSDEEAWDVAAYVNSQTRPEKDISKDWPNIEEKPFDHPFGPFSDGFDEHQHKYGPFKAIIAKKTSQTQKS
ncbi:MAG: c-type cytochrome [Bacteroidia bacterium]|jgi:thiosulfate dehydrogenase|nr:c-type cytochrome [Bacteroidia bacterium]